ncbi:hypothetical protein Tco_0366402 [Tanacetum coccineum]
MLTMKTLDIAGTYNIPRMKVRPYEYLNFTQRLGLLNYNKRVPKEHATIVEEAIEDPFVTDSGIRYFGNLELDQVMKDQKDDDAKITLTRSSIFDLEMEEADSDLCLMLK